VAISTMETTTVALFIIVLLDRNRESILHEHNPGQPPGLRTGVAIRGRYICSGAERNGKRQTQGEAAPHGANPGGTPSNR
jgi:hypothetical protein